MDGGSVDWAVSLYRCSVLKQQKLDEVLATLGDPSQKICLDLGGDNGIISYLLRQRGGSWWSADLDETTVESTRQLVGPDVVLLRNERAPFADNTFDIVVIVDLLEHLHDDRGFVADLARVLRPGGELVVNVPHLKPRSILNRMKHAVGLTDAQHGHVRPGYTLETLREVLGDRFTIETERTYSRGFSETVDILVNLAVLRGAPKIRRQSRKGTVVTAADVAARKKQLWLLSGVYPFLWLWSKLDVLLFRQAGYKLIVKAVRRGDEGIGLRAS